MGDPSGRGPHGMGVSPESRLLSPEQRASLVHWDVGGLAGPGPSGDTPRPRHLVGIGAHGLVQVHRPSLPFLFLLK